MDEHDVPPIANRPRLEGEDRVADAEPAPSFQPAEFTPAVFTPAARDLSAASAAWRDAEAADAVANPSEPAVALSTDFATTLHDAALEVPSEDAPILVPVPAPQPAPVVAPAGVAVIQHEAAPSALARIGEELLAWFKTLLSAAVYATLIVTFGFQVARVEGQSMAPTLEDQDRLIVNKLEYRLYDPKVGDIVMLYYPVDPDKSFVKRVVAEPGDTIRSVNGRVYRNDVPLPDDFIPEEYRSYDTWGPEVVPDGYYFVMGDHRNNSSDSRTWKYVPRKYIIGKVQLRWWPMNHARMF